MASWGQWKWVVNTALIYHHLLSWYIENLLANSCLLTHLAVFIHSESCFWPPGSSVFFFFCLYQHLSEIIWLFNNYMLHYDHQLVASVCCLVLSRECTVGVQSFFTENSCPLWLNMTIWKWVQKSNNKVMNWATKHWAEVLYKAQ